MMSSIWQRWTTTPTFSNDDNDNHEGEAVIYNNNNNNDNDDELPHQVQVGLSIDYSESSCKTETSSLSDFEEGIMPVWANKDDTTTPSSSRKKKNQTMVEQDNDSPEAAAAAVQDCPPHSPLNYYMEDPAPIGLQIPIPQRIFSPDNNNKNDNTTTTIMSHTHYNNTLTQRGSGSSSNKGGGGGSSPHVVISPPRWREDMNNKMDPKNIKTANNNNPKWARIFCMVLALGLVAVSVHDQILDPDLWWERRGGGSGGGTGLLRSDLPTFETRRQAPQLLGSNTGTGTANQQQQVRRSSLAFARASAELPVFMDTTTTAAGADDDEVILFSNVSNSSPLVSFLGGCAFVAILLETGWKGYYQKSSSKRGISQQQAVRRLYK